MKDLYEESWEIYKAHSEVFVDDFKYYFDFCQGHESLELFAGYGRVANHLIEKGIDLTTVELSPEFSKLINLPEEKRIAGDVLEYAPDKKFKRIFAGYNSFCLFSKEEDIQKFFDKLATWLDDDGLASLNYYSTDHWADAVAYDFDYKGQTINYVPSWDLSKKSEKIGKWVDIYKIGEQELTHDYTVRVYEDESDLLPFLDRAGLKLVDTVKEFNLEEIMEPGWIDYIVALK
jgi:hypothetical protein